MWGLKDSHGEYIHRRSQFWGKNYILYTSDINFAYVFTIRADAEKALVRCNNVFKKTQIEIEKGMSREITSSYRSDVNTWIDREYTEVEIIKLALVERPL